MRVLIAVPRLAMPGGVANYYKTLRPYLDEEKVYFEIGGIPGETGRWRKLWRLLTDNWNFHRLLGKQHFDLVHINPSMDPYSLLRDGLLLLLARLHRQRVLVFYRGWFPHVEAHVRQHHARLFRFVYSQADTNIVLAEEFQRSLAEMGVAPPTFIETTVVDDAVFARDADPGVASTGLRVAGAPCRILYLGRLDTGKGLPEAIEAFARLQQRWPLVSLTVAGEGPERQAAEQDVSNWGLHNVRFLGHVSGAAKAQAFQESDIYLFTSLAEGMPNSVLEAMAFGLPIVTRPVGGIRDFFEDGRMGYATDSLDPGDYTERLGRLVSDPALCQSMGQYNREYARRRFSASMVAARLQAIYTQVMARTRAT
jgi:glycosyltransferase involved in cell wall biosynthesis